MLDVGCGYGPVGIAAATFNPNFRVVMTDVNERAVWLAKENAKRNAFQNVEVKQGFLYEPVGDMKFETSSQTPKTHCKGWTTASRCPIKNRREKTR